MPTTELRFTYLNGPTALLEMGGLRLLTDPTFDAAGTHYPLSGYELRKTGPNPLPAEAVSEIDAVLLSHDHHLDNLDRAGREVAMRARAILTTEAGAARLGRPAQGLRPWESVVLAARNGRVLRITATPARHGPDGGDRGPVVGFVLAFEDEPQAAVYVSGDTVWYDGVAEVSRRFPIKLAVLFMGAAKVSAAGPAPLTFTAAEAVEAARAFGAATIVPLHFEGWAHFTESRKDIEEAFAAAGLGGRLVWPQPGQPTVFELAS